MSMMEVCGPVFCPECLPQHNRKGKQVGVRLDCADSNYSGCGVDMASCPECGKGYQISFRVDKIIRVPSWDVDIEENKRIEAEQQEKARVAKIAELEQELGKLRGNG